MRDYFSYLYNLLITTESTVIVENGLLLEESEDGGIRRFVVDIISGGIQLSALK